MTVGDAIKQYRAYSEVQRNTSMKSMKMTMRYAHLSPAFLSAEVSLLDPPKHFSPTPEEGKQSKKGKKRAKRLDRQSVAIRIDEFC